MMLYKKYCCCFYFILPRVLLTHHDATISLLIAIAAANDDDDATSTDNSTLYLLLFYSYFTEIEFLYSISEPQGEINFKIIKSIEFILFKNQTRCSNMDSSMNNPHLVVCTVNFSSDSACLCSV